MVPSPNNSIPECVLGFTLNVQKETTNIANAIFSHIFPRPLSVLTLSSCLLSKYLYLLCCSPLLVITLQSCSQYEAN